jgi:hypothetical protein
MRRAAGILLLWPTLTLAANPDSAAPHSATIRRYCAGCHSPAARTAGLVLNPNEDPAANPAVWEKAVRRMRAGSMPPPGAPRPDAAAYAGVLRSLESTLDAAALRNPNPGRTDTFRRLNRTEYRNVIRDLLAVDVDVSNLLPPDESSHGFDNVTSGELSPALLERYLAAARRISRLAVGIAPRAPTGETYTLPPDLTQDDHVEGLPIGTRGGLLITHTFPVSGTYEFQTRLARDRNEHVEGLIGSHTVELLIDGKPAQAFTVSPPPRGKDHSQVDQHLRLRIPVSAGPRQIGVTFPRRSAVLLETERQPYQAHFNMDRHPRIQPAVYTLNVTGPYDPAGEASTPSRARIFICQPSAAWSETACATRILNTLMRRAYRRPVTPADLAAPLQFFTEARARPDSRFDTAIEFALRAVLVSPEFLFRIERDPPSLAPETSYGISSLELASRLSFFLWSSIPDDELLRLAESRQLSQPVILDQQVKRMLADPRSASLASNFANQWLYLRNLASLNPDMRVFPDFDDNLRKAMRRETELLFETIQREDKSILELIRADYTHLNERLARHYGIPRIQGSHFRRVNLPPGTPRGGILRHASILAVTSYPTRTSPVIRGKWILDNLLGVPPPPPPPNVPALKESSGSTKAATVRERLAAHRENAACAGCHRLMDPIGFALESYDAIGRWRTRDAELPIDISGGLPDGSTFEGIEGLEKAILARPELLAGTFTEKLLTFALGRVPDAYDAPAIRQVVRQAKSSNYRFSAFILEIVRATPFQKRRAS